MTYSGSRKKRPARSEGMRLRLEVCRSLMFLDLRFKAAALFHPLNLYLLTAHLALPVSAGYQSSRALLSRWTLSFSKYSPKNTCGSQNQYRFLTLAPGPRSDGLDELLDTPDVLGMAPTEARTHRLWHYLARSVSSVRCPRMLLSEAMGSHSK